MGGRAGRVKATEARGAMTQATQARRAMTQATQARGAMTQATQARRAMTQATQARRATTQAMKANGARGYLTIWAFRGRHLNRLSFSSTSQQAPTTPKSYPACVSGQNRTFPQPSAEP